MPSLSTARRIASMKNNGAKTIGQIRKEESDFLMEQTWDGDLQSKTCYIYDFYHDDKPWLAEDITHENTTKTKIDAKFIVTKYSSIDKDQVEYHLQFRPSQPVRFTEDDELYYYETDYKKHYSTQFPIGLFVDIPDEKNVYRKWLIVAKEEGNQFLKYSVLPCDYYLHWIEVNGTERIKRKMWCVSRAMNSYTSGRWIDRYMLGLDDIQKIWIPINPITEQLSYIEENKNKRLVLSALIKKPHVWQISKVENTKPLGIIKITLDQDSWDEHTDYVNLETGEMYADYYDSDIAPTDPTEPTPTPSSNYGTITASTSTIKIGGSYKTLTATVFDENGTDITDSYSDADFEWYCSVDGTDLTENTDIITWLDCTTFNKKKIKFSNDRSYLEKILEVKCEIIKDTETIEMTMQFELIV
ncbi:MAG: hypothetical protein IJE43_13180 [Alphaproteobacteria bacterium]|nr:hypothetical protein [Alphaproteobacteria bacterium]